MKQSEDMLKGTTLEVYRFLLKKGKPTGAREIQRTLRLSSPSLAVYHLSKLEEIGLIRKENGEFTVIKNLLDDYVRISRFLIHRYLFYSVFAVLALTIELTCLRPNILTREYVFFIGVTLICALAFCFETAKTWAKGGL